MMPRLLPIIAPLLCAAAMLLMQSCSFPTEDGRRHLVLGIGFIDLKDTPVDAGICVNDYVAGGAVVSTGRELPAVLVGYAKKKSIVIERQVSAAYESDRELIYTDGTAIEHARNSDPKTKGGTQ
jgi:hypothetical protein